MKYYEEADILDYVVATRDGGKNQVPLVAAAAMFINSKQLLDLHFVQFKYKKSYRKQVLSTDEDFLNVVGQRQLAIESLFPMMVEGLNLRDGDLPIQSQRMNTLRVSKIGVVRLPFEKVTSIAQIGNDLKCDKPIYIIVTG
jgi:hypothetical protein